MEELQDIVRLIRREDGNFTYTVNSYNEYTWLREHYNLPLYQCKIKFIGLENKPFENSSDVHVITIDMSKLKSHTASIYGEVVEINYEQNAMDSNVINLQESQEFKLGLSTCYINPIPASCYVFDNECKLFSNQNSDVLSFDDVLSYKNVQSYIKYILNFECSFRDAERIIRLNEPGKRFNIDGGTLVVENVIY